MSKLARYVVGLGLAGLATLTSVEGFRTTPYKDMGGVWTDGYGNTTHVVPGKTVTEAQALATLTKHVERTQAGINACLTRPANQGQSDAYTLLAYNVGVQAFCQSSIARKHNAGDFRGACDAILLYNKVRINGTLQPVRGLTNRRQKERALCLRT